MELPLLDRRCDWARPGFSGAIATQLVRNRIIDSRWGRAFSGLLFSRALLCPGSAGDRVTLRTGAPESIGPGERLALRPGHGNYPGLCSPGNRATELFSGN